MNTAAPQKSQGSRWVYVGSRTEREKGARGDGISIFRMDAATGAWTPVDVVGGMVNPSFLSFDRTGDFLHTVHGYHTGITSFRIDHATGKIAKTGFQETQINPVHLVPDPTNRWMVVANYGSGSMATLPIGAEGALGPMNDIVKLPGEPGPNKAQQPHSRPHHCPMHPGGGYYVVPDKGLDRTFVFRVDATTGKLHFADVPNAVAQPGAGPRHVDFHPDGVWTYVINELDSTVTVFDLDAKTGALNQKQLVSTLPPGADGSDNTTAEIWLTKNGRFVIGSNRGHDTLVVFAVNDSTGELTAKHWVPTGGKKPRFFTLDPSGQFLYAANEDGHTIVTFLVDQEAGTIEPTGQVIEVGSPVCIIMSGVF